METFRVIFKGGISSGYTPDQVKSDLAKIFKLDTNQPSDAGKLKLLLSGKAVVIKAGLTSEQARQYQQVIARAGAVTEVSADPADRYYAPGLLERRQNQRRLTGDRRSVRRSSAILPDRRKSRERRGMDLQNE